MPSSPAAASSWPSGLNITVVTELPSPKLPATVPVTRSWTPHCRRCPPCQVVAIVAEGDAVNLAAVLERGVRAGGQIPYHDAARIVPARQVSAIAL